MRVGDGTLQTRGVARRHLDADAAAIAKDLRWLTVVADDRFEILVIIVIYARH
jgi:hypothetical protein